MTDVLTTPIMITAEAARRLEGLKQEKNLDDTFALRVFVSGGGCSGLQYGMTFDDQIRDGDTEFEESGMRVLVDPLSAKHMTGASIDFIDTLMGGGFKIENPNAVASCGCGSSFRPKEDGSEAPAQGGGCSSGGCGSH